MASLTLISLSAIATVALAGEPTIYSALPTQQGWSISTGCPAQAAACATLEDTLESNGWYTLNIETQPGATDYDQAYGAGFVEAYLTQAQIWSAWLNFANGTLLPMSQSYQDWIVAQDKWVRAQVQANKGQDYWDQVGLTVAQFDGLVQGYAKFAPQPQQLSYLYQLAYQLSYETGDIEAGLPSQKHSSEEARNEALVNSFDSHCSSLIRVSPDGRQLFASQVTWSTYTTMLRVFKHYDFNFALPSNKASGSSFSSFPAILPSGDDYYITSANLVVMETTNGVMNSSLYQRYISTQTVPYWIRVIVANRMAGTAQEWHDVFSMYNSGTYNNQWIVLDNKLFTPGQPLQPNTLWIGEQVPGFYVSADQTGFLTQRGYWMSYNIPFYPFIYNISGYPAAFAQHGNEYSWAHCARANIFQRDAPKVHTLQDMQHIMRYNQWQTDPLALQDACRGISARCDLNAPWVGPSLNGWAAFGAIDGKVTSTELSPTRATLAVCGPTWDFQPVFAWTEQWADVPHYGQPQVFNFDWVTLVPEQP